MIRIAAPAACLALATALAACGEATPPPAHTATAVDAVLAAASDRGYARALAPRRLDFPADHGPHPDFRTEWWYFTGNLEDASGRRFGFQLTFFRFALAPRGPARASALATRQAWMAHLALTDVAAGRFHAFERFARGAAGLAGARAAPFAVHVEDWSARSRAPGALLPLELSAAQEGVALDLEVGAGKPRVLQGDRGLSRKSAAPGNASYYYSYTRLPVAGRVRTPEGSYAVHGHAWLDREWSTSALAPEQSGWDWFALQLDDGRDLMFYRLRRRDGSAHPFSAGVVVDPRGGVTRLGAADVALVPGRRWNSPAGGAYPVRWRLASGDLSLDVEAVLDAQEHRGAFRYWEGAVRVSGSGRGGAVGGRGYLEMTGY